MPKRRLSKLKGWPGATGTTGAEQHGRGVCGAARARQAVAALLAAKFSPPCPMQRARAKPVAVAVLDVYLP